MIPGQRWFTVLATATWNYLALHGCLNLFRQTAPSRTLALYAVLLAIALSAWGAHRLSRRSRGRQ